MRRLVVLPILAVAALGLSACNSGSGSPPTVTVKVTRTGTTASAGPSSSVVVVPNSSTVTKASQSGGASAGPSASAQPSASTTAATSGAPQTAKVDPTKVDCSILLSPADVKKALGVDIPSGSYRIKDTVDATRGVTGKVRCRYGSSDNGKTGKVGVLLTQFKDVASAQKQVDVSRQAAVDNAEQATKVAVAGYPAELLIGKGGEVVMRYNTWTLSVSTRDGVGTAQQRTDGLPKLAEQVLARVLKNG